MRRPIILALLALCISATVVCAQGVPRTITITEGISVKDLAEKLEVRAKDIIARLLMRGVMATVNQTLDAELAKDVAHQFGARLRHADRGEPLVKNGKLLLGEAAEHEVLPVGDADVGLELPLDRRQ